MKKKKKKRKEIGQIQLLFKNLLHFFQPLKMVYIIVSNKKHPEQFRVRLLNSTQFLKFTLSKQDMIRQIGQHCLIGQSVQTGWNECYKTVYISVINTKSETTA